MFQKRVTSTNHDYPFHDFVMIDATEESNPIVFHYVVGQGNVAQQGDQHKYFVSKRLIIWTDRSGLTLRLNHANNVLITPPLVLIDDAAGESMWRLEFHTNINEVFVNIDDGNTAYIYCEGVLPEETRDAE